MKRLLILLPFFALIFSCNTSDDATQQQPEVDNFYALTVGNSWVYKNYKYNINTQVYDDTGVIDSVSIVGTESIFGNTYFKFRTWTTGNEENITYCNPNGEHFEYLREHEGYLIRDNGSIKFVNNVYEPIFVATSSNLSYYYRLNENMTNVQVEAGNFECADMLFYVTNDQGTQLPGTDNYLYADGIGLIYDTSSFVSQDIHTIERRLDAFDVQ